MREASRGDPNLEGLAGRLPEAACHSQVTLPPSKIQVLATTV